MGRSGFCTKKGEGLLTSITNVLALIEATPVLRRQYLKVLWLLYQNK
jgi:hypothetical protein